jgi:NmrA-like family
MNSDRRILVFGAAAHVGGPLAQFIATAAPETKLRLATSSNNKHAALQATFPTAEVVTANYFDEESLVSALKDVHGVFVITPDFFDEITGMEIFVRAIRRSPSVDHIVRLLADTPGMSLAMLPSELRNLGPGPAHQHFEAQAILNASGLPVTYLNSLGYFMDDFLIHFSPPLKSKRKLVIPYDRKMCFTECAELGEAGARLLLQGPDRHAGCYYHFNNAEPPRLFSEVAKLMSEVTGETVVHDGSPETFIAELGPLLKELTGDDRAARYFVVNWQMERDHQDAFFASDWSAEILDRQPTTLKAWLVARKDVLL